MEDIQGPDFPTSGLILGKSGIRRAYETGRGSIQMRARASIEERGGGRQRIVVTEIPYQVNKARMIEKIAELAREKRIEGITDLRDETSLRTGVRVVIDVRKDANANVILNNLYKHTPLQTSFGVNMIALVNGRPKLINLKEALVEYLEHQKTVVRRRTEYNLKKAKDRAHILEGLRIALDHIDEIISIIRESDTDKVAMETLQERFKLSERQAQAILDMRLRRLTGLERDKIENEYNELLSYIAELEEILANEDVLLQLVRDELTEIKERFGDERRTEIQLGSKQKEYGVRTLDMAKRLLDFGVHPPTIYFPLNVEEGMMIEPTETESKETLDYFIDAMLQIADEVESDPDKVLEAPHTTIIDRLDETTAARKPILKFEDLHQEKL